MLLYFLLAGCFGLSFTDVPTVTVLQHSVAMLPCPHTSRDVSWSRYRSEGKVVLVTVKNGEETRHDKRYGSLADNSLIIRDVTPSDSTTYLCNGQRVYLKVTTNSSEVTPSGNVPVIPRDHGLGLGFRYKGAAAEGDPATDNQPSSDLWKIPAGVVVGAAVVLSVVLTLRFCSKNRGETNGSVDKTVAEVIYEEIEAGEQQPRRESDVESPYYWTTISDPPSTSTPTNNNLYSSVNKMKTKGRSNDECVYYLAQSSPQTGSVTQ